MAATHEHQVDITTPVQVYGLENSAPIQIGAVNDALKVIPTNTSGTEIDVSTETTQLLVKAAVQTIAGAVGVSDGADPTGIVYIGGDAGGTLCGVELTGNCILKVVPSDGSVEAELLGTQADGVANTKNSLFVTPFLMGFNGSTWDRLRSSVAHGLQVDVTQIAAGTNAIGNIGVIPRTTGGLTTYHLASGASTNATVVKNSAGQLFGWYIYNSNAAARKLAFHNASSTPTAGSSIFFSLVIPAGGAANVFNDIGIAFSTGIAITTVTGLADSDNTGVAANDLIINLWYA